MTERTLNLEEFQSLGRRCGFRFVCPSCGNVATPRDFEAAGADPQRAAQECIGRLQRPMAKPADGVRPCDWAAFGLLKTLGKGITVVFPDGHETEAFALDESQP